MLGCSGATTCSPRTVSVAQNKMSPMMFGMTVLLRYLLLPNFSHF
jgi:hypothetical protein